MATRIISGSTPAQRLSLDDEHDGQGGRNERDPHALPHDRTALPHAAGAAELRDDRGQRHAEACHQHEDRPEHIAAHGDPGEVDGVVVPGHGRVDEAHGHDAELGRHHGQAQAQESARLVSKSLADHGSWTNFKGAGQIGLGSTRLASPRALGG